MTKKSTIPLYLQLKEHLLDEIREGKVNGQISSISKLIRQFNVSLSTINRTLFELEKEGLIERRHGKGIFIVQREHEIIRERGAHHSKRIVIAFPDYPSYELDIRLAAIEKAALMDGYSTLHIRYKEDTTYEILADLIKKHAPIDGILYTPPATRIPGMHYKLFNSFKVPFIILEEQDVDAAHENIFVVSADYEETHRQVMSYLIGRGHTRFTYIGNEPSNAAAEKRLIGMQRALAENGLPASALATTDTRIKPWENSLVAGYELTKAEVMHSNASAYIYDSATGAFGGLRALAEAGKKVPEDVSVIGENDWQYFEYANPPLTVVRFDLEHWMQKAIAIVKDPSVCERKTYVGSKIIERRTVSDRRGK